MRTPRTLLLLASAVFLVGCSSGPQESSNTPQVEMMADVAGLLRDYTADNNKGPSKLADLAKYETLYSRGYQQVKVGDIVVVWGVPMPMDGGGTGVIAYEKKAEAEGGAVLLENGSSKMMTAAEFKAAPKAAKK